MDWLAALQADEGSLNPSLKTLVQSLLDAAEEGVLVKEAQRAQEQQAARVSDESRADLDRSVARWAERGHSELRSSLEAGFASKRWKGLAWWKLFWRVDDVGMITSEILEKQYLHGAEREVIWTAGQFQQAGLIDKVEATEKPHSEAKEESTTAAADKTASEPWPMQISKSRTRLLDTTVPALQSLAQRLVLFSVSTTTLTSALSALTYISLPTASVYETCTMAVVGLVYSLRRQQTKWEKARTFWEEEVREDGRTALLETERELRTIVKEGGRPEIDVSDVQEAKESIEQARRAVDVNGKST